MTEMTITEYVRAVGPHTKAWAEGYAEGYAEGQAKRAAGVLLRLLARKFGAIPDQARDRIGAASIDQLDLWTMRVLDATTLDDVLDR